MPRLLMFKVSHFSFPCVIKCPTRACIQNIAVAFLHLPISISEMVGCVLQKSPFVIVVLHFAKRKLRLLQIDPKVAFPRKPNAANQPKVSYSDRIKLLIILA